MTLTRILFAAACSAPVILGLVGAEPNSPCVPSTPGNVVRCLNLAFQNRDSTSVAGLLADTFVWEYRSKEGEQVPDPADKAITMQMLGRLFNSPKVIRFACWLFFDGRPKSTGEGAYLLEGVHAIWEVEDQGSGAGGDSIPPTRTHRAEKKNITLEVLRLPGPEPRYVLSHWTEDAY